MYQGVTVHVVYYDTFYDGEYSICGVAGVFIHLEDAIKMIQKKKDSCTNYYIEEVKITDRELKDENQPNPA